MSSRSALTFTSSPKFLTRRAAGLVDTMPFGLCRERNCQRRGRAAIQQEVTYFAEDAAHRQLIAIVQIGDILDDVRRDKWPKLELDVLVRRKFVFKFGFARPVTAVALAHPRNGFQGDLFLAFEAYARTFGKAENIFCFDVAIESLAILGAGARAGYDEQWRGKDKRARRASVKHIQHPHPPGSRPGNQAARQMQRAVQKQFKNFPAQVNARGIH